MYATAYRTRHGFWSVGFLASIDGRGARIGDPVLGFENVRLEDTMGVVHTETGAVLPDVHPVLVSDMVSLHLAPQARLGRAANQANVVMLQPRRGGAAFASGYPAAWQMVQRFRDQVDWRFISLAAIFARTTIQRAIEEAERLYRIFGPALRDAVLGGRVPTIEQLSRTRGIRSRQLGLNDAKSYASIFRWAPWAEKYMREAAPDYSRTVRDGIALNNMPWGVNIAKLSFTMMLTGRDGACLDTRMLNYFFESDKAARAKFERDTRKVTRRGQLVVPEAAVREYRRVESGLSFTPYFDPDWPQPYAKAQWMLWETLGRTAGTATHGALWEVLGPVIEAAERDVAAAE